MRALSLAVVAALALAAVPAQAGDPKEGRNKATLCQTCHGLKDGLAKLPEAPNLAGQTEPYLITSLTAYKTGARKNDMMSAVAPSLSQKDIEDLAAYFASIKFTVEPME
jgi:cytochrome c553